MSLIFKSRGQNKTRIKRGGCPIISGLIRRILALLDSYRVNDAYLYLVFVIYFPVWTGYPYLQEQHKPEYSMSSKQQYMLHAMWKKNTQLNNFWVPLKYKEINRVKSYDTKLKVFESWGLYTLKSFNSVYHRCGSFDFPFQLVRSEINEGLLE